MLALVWAVLAVPVGMALARVAAFVPDSSGGGRERPSRAMRIGVVSATVVTFVVVALVVGADWAVVPITTVAGALVALSAVDIDRFRLPDRLLFPSLALAILSMVAVSVATDRTDHLLPAAFGAIAFFVLLLIPNLISPAGLAFGDVKLALLLGLTIGWTRSVPFEVMVLIVYAMILGMILGIVSGVFVGIGRRVLGPDFLPDPDFPIDPDGPPPSVLRTAFPFGPALALSAMTLVLFGGALVDGASLF